MTLKTHHFIALIGIPLCLLFLVFGPTASALTEKQLLSAALILTAIFLFATSVLPEYVTALLLMVGAMLLAIAPAEVVFSGFYSTACWLIFAGFVMGIAIKETGLAQRIAALFGETLTTSYTKIITSIVAISSLTGFLMPSSLGRAVLLVPIAMAIADRCRFSKTSNGRIGIALAVAFGCHVPTFSVLTANVPNMVFIGATETIHHWTPAYAEYLLLHFPILGILKALIIIGLILWLYPDTPNKNQCLENDTSNLKAAPFSINEKKLAALLVVTLAFWVTDTLHHISAAWIGLTTACILLLPKIGLVDKKSFNTQFNIGSLLFVVGILSLGAIINDSGLGQLMGKLLDQWLPLSQETPFINYIALSLTGVFTGVFTTLPGVPAVLTPFAEQMSNNSGFSIQAILMLQVLGFSTIIFPFQSAPLVVAMQLADISLKHAAKLCIVLTIITIGVLFPLDYLWWELLGKIN